MINFMIGMSDLRCVIPRCDGAFYFSRTESKLQPSKSCNVRFRAGILSVTNGRSECGRFRRMAGRINIKKKKNIREALANVRREGPEKCDESIVRCTPIYTYVYVSIPGRSIHLPTESEAAARILFLSRFSYSLDMPVSINHGCRY